MRSIAIMQPYFLPYIGYFQLLAAVDQFVVYDNIQYTKKGWINRNRLLRQGRDVTFSLPLKKASDYLDIKARTIAEDFDRIKLLNQFKEAYQKAPYFEPVYALVRDAVMNNAANLFDFIDFSIRKVCAYLAISTDIIVSSSLDMNHDLQGVDRVIGICQHLGAARYINAIGGQELYSKAKFAEHAIELKFLKPQYFEYKQFAYDFVPWLSIIDVMMFNSTEQVQGYLRHHYELV